MTLTHSLQEARIQTLIEMNVTNYRGFNPKNLHDEKINITRDQLIQHLSYMNTTTSWNEIFEPTVSPIIPAISDPDQRVRYSY